MGLYGVPMGLYGVPMCFYGIPLGSLWVPMCLCGVPVGPYGATRDPYGVRVGVSTGRPSVRQFAAVQFSNFPEPIFSLLDYSERPQPRELLRHVRQQGGFTDTFTAIRYVACVSPDRLT